MREERKEKKEKNKEIKSCIGIRKENQENRLHDNKTKAKQEMRALEKSNTTK